MVQIIETNLSMKDNEIMDHQSRMIEAESWEQELPTEEEMQNGINNLTKHDNKVDFILSHSPSTSELYLMGGKGLY